MESIVKFLEKGQPYFDKVSKNIYLQAIKDGFLASRWASWASWSPAPPQAR